MRECVRGNVSACVSDLVIEWVGSKKVHCKIPKYNTTEAQKLIIALLTVGAVDREVLMPGVGPCNSTWLSRATTPTTRAASMPPRFCLTNRNQQHFKHH